MSVTQPRFSLGALALVVCLAVPAGMLSMFARNTTGEQVDAADLILVGRVASLQVVEEPPRTSVEIAQARVLVGSLQRRSYSVTVEGRVPVAVGDHVLAMIGRRPTRLLGVYQLRKNEWTHDYEVITPVTGMIAQGLVGGGPHDPLPLPAVEMAILMRRGGSLDPSATPDDGGGAAELGTTVPPDAFEPNNTLATATFVTGLHPPTMVTGNPLIITGLTITAGDVDYFRFDTPQLALIHAETLPPVTGLTLDTLIGLFDANTGELLAWNDDVAPGNKFSLIINPLERPGPYAVAVESAPDPNLLFDGSTGTTTGEYALSLELERGQYIGNQWDIVAGVSADGTFIEDQIGFRKFGIDDVLLSGAPADGWALDYDVNVPPTGVTHVYGGSGDQLTDPGFLDEVVPISFELTPFDGPSGLNRLGRAAASNIVLFTDNGAPQEGVIFGIEYLFDLYKRTLEGDITIQMGTTEQVTDLVFSRVMDVDLFGVGRDRFFWSFSPSSKVKAFAVDTATHVGNIVVPAQTLGDQTDDLQFALLIEHGDSNGTGLGDVTHYKTAFTLIHDLPTQDAAKDEAKRRLEMAGMTTWVIAVDRDQSSNTWAAFGVGLSE
jgi:hypothetical protein